MATFEQLPAEVGVKIVKGDEFSMTLDFDHDLTGYTYDAKVYTTTVSANPGGTGSVIAAGATTASFTITPIALTAGQINLSLNETETGRLNPSVGYRWYVRYVTPGLVTRTVIAGEFSARNP